MKSEPKAPIDELAEAVASAIDRGSSVLEPQPSNSAAELALPTAIEPFAPAESPIAQDQSIVSIPNSLREQLQRVQLLLNQSEHAKANGREEVAQTKAQQAVNVMNTLINRSTECGTLAVLADMGCQGYDYSTVEETEAFVVLEKRAFGMSFGQEIVPTKKIVKRNARGRVF